MLDRVRVNVAAHVEQIALPVDVDGPVGPLKQRSLDRVGVNVAAHVKQIALLVDVDGPIRSLKQRSPATEPFVEGFAVAVENELQELVKDALQELAAGSSPSWRSTR